MSDLEADMEELIREYGTRYLKEQSDLAESDLLDILGRRASWLPEKIQKLGYEVVWQKAPNGAALDQYRGIRRHGKWVRDRFPEWPFYPEQAPDDGGH